MNFAKFSRIPVELFSPGPSKQFLKKLRLDNSNPHHYEKFSFLFLINLLSLIKVELSGVDCIFYTEHILETAYNYFVLNHYSRNYLNTSKTYFGPCKHLQWNLFCENSFRVLKFLNGCLFV